MQILKKKIVDEKISQFHNILAFILCQFRHISAIIQPAFEQLDSDASKHKLQQASNDYYVANGF